MPRKKLPPKERLVASFKRKIKNLQTKIDRSEAQHAEYIQELKDKQAEHREMLKALGIRK